MDKLTEEQMKLFKDARKSWLEKIFEYRKIVYIYHGEFYLNIRAEEDDDDMNPIIVDSCDYNTFEDFNSAVNNIISKL